MSIGGKPKDDKTFDVPITKQAEYLIKKSVAFLWQDPLKNIFLIFLIICLGGLASGHHFPFEFYLILSILAIVEIYLFFIKPDINMQILEAPKKEK